MTSERRQFSRVAFDARAELALRQDSHVAVKVLDLSFKGALVRVPEAIQVGVGHAYTLNVQLAQLDAQISMAGEVAHVDGTLVGLQCRSIDLDSITHLRKLIELNLGEPSLLERELKALSGP